MPSLSTAWTALTWWMVHHSLPASSWSFSQTTQSAWGSLPDTRVFATSRLTRGAAAGNFFDEISEDVDGENTDGEAEESGEETPRMSEEELKASMGEWDPRVPKLNTVTLSGRVGNDPDPRYFDDGKVVLNLSLAVKRKYHPLERKARNIKSGEEETDWFPLEIWGRDAEYAAKYIDKGARIGVTGSLQVDTWTDRNTGEPREKPKIIVKHLDVLETRGEAELRRQNKRGPAFHKENDDGGPSPAGTGGFFD